MWTSDSVFSSEVLYVCMNLILIILPAHCQGQSIKNWPDSQPILLRAGPLISKTISWYLIDQYHWPTYCSTACLLDRLVGDIITLCSLTDMYQLLICWYQRIRYLNQPLSLPVSMWFLFAYLSYWDVKTWSGQSLQYSASLWTFKWRLQAKFIRLLHSQLPTQALVYNFVFMFVWFLQVTQCQIY